MEDKEKAQEYSSHRLQLETAQPDQDRLSSLEASLIEAFDSVIEYREVPFILFSDLNAQELATAFTNHPIIVKAVLSCVNVAQRAVKRDLGFDLQTYGSTISLEKAQLLAGYVKPMLPPALGVPALIELDRFFWADKEMRAAKGNWEKRVCDAVGRSAGREFRKRKFEAGGESYEIDAAYPSTGRSIKVAIDVKRIESSRDIHKRSDEIINKAEKFKSQYGGSKFFAVVYYPFPNQHLNLRARLESPSIDGVFFAAENDSSIDSAAEMLVGASGVKKKVIPSSSL